MPQAATFGQIVRDHRDALGLTQAELARRAGCAPITIRKIESDDLRPSVQLAELLALALKIPEEEQLAFVRLARQQPDLPPIPTPSPTPSEIGLDDLSGRAVKGFQLGERIGSGGFGIVYQALQPSVQREVAVKIILPRYANHPDFIRRFEAEAHLVARLEHPHIVPLYDYWREPDAAYLIMRLLRGGSLEQLIKNGILTLELILRVVQQVGTALDAAHRAGVIHRDIKPANVLLDEDQNAYLADFGIAKNLEQVHKESLTAGGAIVGSPAYISPEQIKAEPVQPQSDIYCFGIMLFEMLTGRQPFPGPTPVAYIHQHLNDHPPSLREFNTDLPAALDVIVQRATAKNLADRYASITAMLRDLEQAFPQTMVLTHLAAPINGETAVYTRLDTAELAALENPYRGLRSFTEADADNFFGRDTLVQELLGMMSDGADLERFIAVVGPSGGGKSSVVKAGVIPTIRRGGLPDSEHWFIVDLTPGTHPWEEVEAALLRIAVNPPDSLLAQLRDGNRGLLRAVQRVLPADDKTELVMVIDQFEELFTLVEDEAVRTHFLESLVTAVLDPRSRLRVIITMRADFTDRPLNYVDFGEMMRRRTAFILPLTPDELTQAITRPVEQLGLQMEPRLVSTITAEVGQQPGMLPLLQYALTELFEQREGQIITLKMYHTTGGVTGALARRADEIFESLDPASQMTARQLFLRLITLGEGVEDTRRRVLQEELLQLGSSSGSSSLIPAVLETFGRHRLLTFDHDPVTRSPTVEVAHEALLREWPRLRQWLADSRDDIRQQRLLAEAARLWQANGRDDSYLLLGSRLTAFEAWVQTTTVKLTADERSFLEASLAAREKRHKEEEERRQRELATAQKLAEEQTRSAQRLRYFVAGLAVLLVIAIGATLFANAQRTTAQENFTVSERGRLALEALNAANRGEGGDLSALLALSSLGLGYSEEANVALQTALHQGFPEQVYVGHTDALQIIRFAPDGLTFASAGNDTIIRLWDTQSGQEIRQFVGHTASIGMVDFSADGAYLVSASADQTVRLWDTNTGEELLFLDADSNTFPGVDISSMGNQLLIASTQKIEILEIPSGRLIKSITENVRDADWTVELSPNEKYIVTDPIAGQVRIWDAETGRELRQLIGHTGWVGYASFSPDSQYILTTGQDGTARIWDVETGNELRRFTGHTEPVFNGFFSPDGRYVITGSYDNTARLWDVATGRQIRVFNGHTDFVNVAFSPNGQQVLTASGDHTIKLWDINLPTEPQQMIDLSAVHLQDQSAINVSADGQLIAVGRFAGAVEITTSQSDEVHTEFSVNDFPVTAQALSADNQYIAVGNNQGHVQLRETATGVLVWELQEHIGTITSIAISQNGAIILTGSQDGQGHLIDLMSGEIKQRLIGHEGGILSVALSADGNQAVTGGSDMTARIWDTTTGEETAVLNEHMSEVYAVAFSSNNNFVVTGGADHIAYLWGSNSGERHQTFIGHTDKISRIAVSAGDRYVLTGSDDKTARLWDLKTGTEIHQYASHISPLLFVSFSGDGDHVFTADSESAYTWRITLDDLIEFACSQLTREFTHTERDFYGISSDLSTCGQRETQLAKVEPRWTPIASPLKPVDAIQAVTDIEFIHADYAYIQMGNPMQHIYIETDEEGMVIRPDNLDPETLNQPLYSTAVFVEDDFVEPPFDRGPYPKGQPLNIDLDTWLKATGHGTYTQRGSQAYLDFQFNDLIPHGIYTLWCVEIQFEPFTPLVEAPCGPEDGSENTFIADEDGYGSIQLEMEAFPPSSAEIIYEIAVAYHSDGLTHGYSVGEFSKNAHVVFFYDFLPQQ